MSGPMLEDSELGWTPDMVHSPEWGQLVEIEPPRTLDVSPVVDNPMSVTPVNVSGWVV